jgi:hypothetical protein
MANEWDFILVNSFATINKQGAQAAAIWRCRLVLKRAPSLAVQLCLGCKVAQIGSKIKAKEKLAC